MSIYLVFPLSLLFTPLSSFLDNPCLLSSLHVPHPLPHSVSTDEIMQMEKDSNINHCHDNSQATEDREREKQLARKRLYVVSAVCLVFMIGEILGGYFAGSLAVMTDAAHLLVDFASFIISLVSLWLSSRPATRTLSYGWHRAEILGALLSVVTIWLVTGVLVYLAVQRLISDNYEIEGTIMLITSGCAVLANIIMAFTLHQSGNHSHGNGNQENHSYGKSDANASVRAAFVHVVGDLLQSISVLVSAIIIFFKVSGQRSTGVMVEIVVNWGDGRGSGQLGSYGR
uniref:Proton-coupled zinc antiporter SLC30A8 n=1 Tax=Hucho hucho TaxID=62062 RepID=A0A4W5N7Q5_9TELE